MMQKIISVFLVIVILVTGSYIYYEAFAQCRIPITYSLSQVDERFGISFEEARNAVSDAEAVWEDATGRNIFSYEETGGRVTVNFLYDGRQEFADSEEKTRAELDGVKEVNDQVNQTYETLIAKYRTLEGQYKSKIATYEANLDQFNTTVEQYNAEGGAPPEMFDELQAERRSLDAQVRSINAVAGELNDLSDQINEISDEGNSLIEQYNETVQSYNQTFGESREFTQGDYSDRNINIYKFSDRRELLTVLAHEFGHALAVDHVEGEESVMYYLMGEQPEELALSDPDVAAFVATCGDGTGWRSLLPFN